MLGFFNGYCFRKKFARFSILQSVSKNNASTKYVLKISWYPGLVDQEDKHKEQASKASCSIPAATLKAKLKALAPLGAGLVSSLLYRSDYQGSLKGHYDHSLLSSTVFLVVISL